MATYGIQRGDTKPLRVTLRKTTGAALDLGVAPDQSLVDFRMRSAVTGETIIDRPAVVLQDVNLATGFVEDEGVVEFHWLPGDTDVPGTYRVHYRVTDVAGDVEYVPNKGAFDLVIE